MKLQITKVNNGYILESSEDDETVYKIHEVIESGFEGKNPEKIAEMLYSIADYFEEYGSRYDEKRIQVRIVHGDKYECNDEQCEICKEEEWI